MAGPLAFVVQAQNVQPVIAPRVRIIHPTGRRARGRTGTGEMAQPAIHLIRHRQDDVIGRERLAQTVGGNQPHHRILIRLAGIVGRENRNAIGDKPVPRRLVRQGLRQVVRAGHLIDVSGRVGNRQPPIHRQRRANHRAHVLVEIALAGGGRVDRAGRVGHRLIGDAETAGDHGRDAVGAGGALDDLRVDGVVGRQDAEHRVIAVHAVHAEIIPADDRVIGRGLAAMQGG